MVGWHHWLNGHGFRWTPGVGDGQGGLAWYSPWGRKDSDMEEWLNWTEVYTIMPLWNLSYCTVFVKLAFNGDQEALPHFLLSCHASLSTAVTQQKRIGRTGRKSQEILQRVPSPMFLTHSSPRFLEGFWEMSPVGAVVMGTGFSELKIKIHIRSKMWCHSCSGQAWRLIWRLTLGTFRNIGGSFG